MTITDTNTLTFEQGYARLQAIRERVTSEEVPVSEMCDLFAEGKGLERSLTEYLTDQKGRVEAIERGEGVQNFRIVASTEAMATSELPDVPPDTADTNGLTPARASAQTTDDDIPF